MCGRVSLGELRVADLQAFFDLQRVPPLPGSYNVSPSEALPVVRLLKGRRTLELMHWGLIPRWAKGREIARHTFNARLETLTQKPSFRGAIRSQRCLVVADGFYEWRRTGEGKQPYYIHHQDRSPLAFAGLWDGWQEPAGGEFIESCTIITREAFGPLAEIHARMPAVLPAEHFAIWLDPHFRETHLLHDLLLANEPELEFYPVSSYVSNARNDGRTCQERLESTGPEHA